MDSFLIFDIETVPDIESGASILGLTNLSDEAVSYTHLRAHDTV